MPCLIESRSRVPTIHSCVDNPRREPCLFVSTEHGHDWSERHTYYYNEYLPRAPPSSPTKFTPLTFFAQEDDDACPSTSCALHLVDQKIEAHRARLSPIQHPITLGPCSPALLSENAFGRGFESSLGEPMHRMTPLRQVSSAYDDDGMTLANSSYHGIVHPSDKEINYDPTAIGVQYRRIAATSSQSETRPPSHKSLTFGIFNMRTSREAVAGRPYRFRFPSHIKNASGSRHTFTGRNISSPTPADSSAISDMEVPLEYKQGKTKSWPGPCAQLQGQDTVNMPGNRSCSRKCEFACAFCRERNARCDGAIPSCGECISSSESFSCNEYGIGLQTLAEHARGEDVIEKEQTVIMEEERSHFSDDSTDEDDDDGDKVPSNVRLFNSLGRLNQRSKTRLSWGTLFSKP